ncbi:uncharacterized protein [Montipora capricornis]|uniref:uncharacterized protein isoform X2 n=1 Tax=Montipora capricornis TaxID=246305 RepID=UPI0035F10FAA
MKIIIVCFLAFQTATPRVCREDQYAIKLPNRKKPFCMTCPKCPPGSGSTVPCGTTIPTRFNASEICKPCTVGEYSDSFSSESCKTCSKCLPNEIVEADCTSISDTRCSCEPCPKGFYRNETTFHCLPCSECVKGINEKVEQCARQKISGAQICGYRKRKLSGPNCWYDEITVLKRNGKHSCQACPVCSKVSGLTVPCGSIVREGISIACKRPTDGTTFVDKDGVLRPCSVCSPDQEVIRNCSSHFDTQCGRCKQGFFYNSYSKTCQECFSCCNHISSDDIINCIRKRMSFATLHDDLLRSPRISVQLLSHSARDDYEYSSLWSFMLAALEYMLPLGFSFYFAANLASQWRYYSKKLQRRDFQVHNFDEVKCNPLHQERKSKITVAAFQDTSVGTESVTPEYPVRKSPCHMIFEKTGVEVLAPADGTKSVLPNDMILRASSNSTEPGFLEQGEISLSPAIALSVPTKLERRVEVQIPHGANLILSQEDWNVILKAVRNDRWVNLSQDRTGDQGISNFVAKSNHVSFETDRLSKFAVVGKLNEHSLSALKRMKVAAFCNETNVGENLVVRVYCFDDCEYSFERLKMEESDKGGKLISSIESVDFSVGSGKDVEINVKDTRGWQLDPSSTTKIGYKSLRNSFDIIPNCKLVFQPTAERKTTFFALMNVTHEPFFQTMVYASTALK